MTNFQGTEQFFSRYQKIKNNFVGVRFRDQNYLTYFAVAKLTECDNQEHMKLKIKWVMSLF